MRLIDADQASSIENLDQYSDLAAALGDVQTVRDILSDAPTIDAVPVVRCRECKNLYVGGVCFGETLWACRKLKTSVDPEFFCGFGEQKEDEHDKHPSDPV